MDPDAPWITPSELADEAYCPRARWYRTHPPAEGRDPVSDVRADRGTAYHARRLGAERRRDERAAAYGAALAIGIVAVAGGIGWLLVH